MSGNTPSSEAPVMPIFEELKGALSGELQAEFEELGTWMTTLPSIHPGSDGEKSYDGGALTPEENLKHIRFTELSKIATESLKQSGWTPEQPKTQGLLQRLHDSFTNVLR